MGVQARALDVERLVPERVGDRWWVGPQRVADRDRTWRDVPVQKVLEVIAVDLGPVDFDVTAEQVRGGASHRGPQLVAHPPGGLIRPEPEQRLEGRGADTVLRNRHQLRHLKPHRQRGAGVLDDRPSEHLDPLAAPAARPASTRQPQCVHPKPSDHRNKSR